MKLNIRNLFAVLMLLSLSNQSMADNNKSEKQVILSQLMLAISQDNYTAFVSNGNPQFKRGITKQAFGSVTNQVGNLIQSGYKAEYLAELNQQGNKVHLWKISYDESNENTLAKLIIIENKVAGFWLQ
jgi:hypothetical protein